MREQIATALFLALLAGAMLYAHTTHSAEIERQRIAESRLDMAGVVGWTVYDPATMQFVFTKRR